MPNTECLNFSVTIKNPEIHIELFFSFMLHAKMLTFYYKYITSKDVIYVSIIYVSTNSCLWGGGWIKKENPYNTLVVVKSGTFVIKFKL